MTNLKANKIAGNLCIGIFMILVSFSPAVDAKPYSLDRNQEIIDLWNKGLSTLDKIGSNKKNTITVDINETEITRNYFTKMPNDHLLRGLGMAAVNIRKINILYFAKNRSGLSEYISQEMTKSVGEVTPVIKLVQGFTPEKWDQILNIFPEISKFVEYLNSYYAFSIQLYRNNIRSEKHLQQVVSAIFEATYIMAATRMDKKKYSIEASLSLLKEVRGSTPYRLGDEYYALKHSLIAYAIIYNNSCDGVLDLLVEPKKLIEYKINPNIKLSEELQLIKSSGELQFIYDTINLADARCKIHK